MGIFVIFFSIIWAGLGLLMKKFPELIAGYNTMSKEKQKNVDIQAVGNLMCKGFYVMEVPMVALYFLLRLLDMPVRIAILGLFAPVFLCVPVLIAISQKYDKNPRSKFVRYLPVGIVTLLIIIVATVLIYIFI